MAIRLPTPPPGGLAAVATALTDLQTSAARNSVGGASLNGPWRLFAASRNGFTATAPHPCYHLGLGALIEGVGLAAAELVGWRYLLEDNGRTVALAEVSAPSDGSPARFRSFNAGRFGPATVQAIERAETLDFVQAADYELRVLRVPALYVIALWLHSPTDNVLVPLAPSPSPIAAGRPYSEPAFIAVLKPLAAARAAFRE
jgi:hypothetical protein